MSVAGLYPDGYAAKSNQMPLTALSPSPDFAAVAKASRAFAETVTEPAELADAVDRAIKVAQEENNPDHFNILINALGDPAEVVRCEAAAVLGNLAHRPAVPSLLPLLAHPSYETRKSAILAIMKIGQPETIAALQTAMAKDTNDSLQPIYNLAITQLQKKSDADDWD